LLLFYFVVAIALRSPLRLLFLPRFLARFLLLFFFLMAAFDA